MIGSFQAIPLEAEEGVVELKSCGSGGSCTSYFEGTGCGVGRNDCGSGCYPKTKLHVTLWPPNSECLCMCTQAN